MPQPEQRFSASVQRCFSRSAANYQRGATLQAAVAARLGGLIRAQASPLPPGPRADLGAGSGLLARAIEAQLDGPPLLRLDACPALLAQELRANGTPPQREWDLNQGLPAELRGAALLASSFALQWLAQPADQLGGWCDALRSGGVLALALPCRGSFSLWQDAARRAEVPCTALPLPEPDQLIQRAAQALELTHGRVLRFSRPNPGALAFLQQIKGIGAQASPAATLHAGQLRRLIRHWPGPEQAIVWHVLVLMGRKR